VTIDETESYAGMTRDQIKALIGDL
jgi:hypothetical protein